jgi:NAD(P)-dependent dehydrogenase (short-subunit alcohol dehydrogenase family)
MNGKVCIVTGANSGIGKEMVRQLADQGAHVVLVCRNPERGGEALAAIQGSTPRGSLELHIADLSSMAEVQRLSVELRARHLRIDVLLNNAGIYLPTRRATADGLETMFALNHLAPFLLTRELMEPLAAAGRARVITTSSQGHRGGHIDFDDLQSERGRFSGLRQYCNSKLANILFTRELARRVADRGIVTHCFHPGTVKTGFAQDEMGLFGWLVKLTGPFMRTAEKAARIGTYLASSEEPARQSGLYYVNHRPRTPSREARNDEVARRLWDASESILRPMGF